ncbi:MAG: VanZ family protein [Actinomycetia bacterium]|nr:VanZ family protein [Actinomycetes bacterium]
MNESGSDRTDPSLALRIVLRAGIAMALLLVLVLTLHPAISPGPGRSIQLIPLYFLSSLAEETGIVRWFVWRNIIGNFLLFMPFAGLVACASGWRSAVLWTAVVVLLIEASQFVFFERVADIDDVILAVAGASCAAAIVTLGSKLFRRLGPP